VEWVVVCPDHFVSCALRDAYAEATTRFGAVAFVVQRYYLRTWLDALSGL